MKTNSISPTATQPQPALMGRAAPKTNFSGLNLIPLPDTTSTTRSTQKVNFPFDASSISNTSRPATQPSMSLNMKQGFGPRAMPRPVPAGAVLIDSNCTIQDLLPYNDPAAVGSFYYFYPARQALGEFRGVRDHADQAAIRLQHFHRA